MIYIRAARLIDGTGAAPLDDTALIVDGTEIVAVGPATAMPAPPSAQIVDLGGRTLLPGLIDLHAHLTAYAGRATVPFDPATAYAFGAAANLRRAIEVGVTTIRDVGSFGDVSIAARWAVEQGHVVGPRVVACRNIICMTGGHGSEGEPGMVREADGPDDVRKAVREQVRGGADLIKVTTNGPLNIPEFTQAELDALVDEAHNAGRRVACHASILPSVKKAIRAGVDTIEHGSELDDEAVEAMRARGIFLVPTSLILANLMERWEEVKLNPMFRSIPVRHASHGRSFELALRAGVKIGTGVDAAPGLADFADVAGEARLMVAYGAAPMAAIRAATSVAAEALGLADRIGALGPGMAADMIAVEGNPLDDIGALAAVEFVMREGRVLRRQT